MTKPAVKKVTNVEYPTWVCLPCGSIYGRRAMGIATIHYDTCGICGKYSYCTEPRDFGHLKEDWYENNKGS